MSESITFSRIHNYNTLQSGITVGVSLHFGDESVDCEAKIDTGSSHCIFKKAYAELLGIDIDASEKISVATVTGSFEAFIHRIEIDLMGIRTETPVLFPAHQDIFRNILGRLGWLDRIKLGLIDYEGKLLLSKYE